MTDLSYVCCQPNAVLCQKYLIFGWSQMRKMKGRYTLGKTISLKPICDLKFGKHTHGRSRSVIGYVILTFQIIKGHFKSNKFLYKIPH